MALTYLHYISLPTSVFKRMFSDDEHKNVHISTIDGVTLLAHSSVLAAVSTKFNPVFSATCNGPFKIDTPHVNGEQWGIILELIYTGKVNVPEGFTVKTLRTACESLQMHDIADYLLQFELDNTDIESADEEDAKQGNVENESVDVEDTDSQQENFEDTVATDAKRECGLPVKSLDETELASSDEDVDMILLDDSDSDDLQDTNTKSGEDVRIKTEVFEEDMEINIKSEEHNEESDFNTKSELDDSILDVSNNLYSSLDPEISDEHNCVPSLNTQDVDFSLDTRSNDTRSPKAEFNADDTLFRKLCDKSNNRYSNKDFMALDCELCAFSSKNIHDAANHLKEEHGLTNCYVCRICDTTFASHVALCVHARRACFSKKGKFASKMGSVIKMNKTGEFEHHLQKYDMVDKNCKKCGKKSLTISAAVTHLRNIHHIRRCYVCKKCGKDFLYRSSLHIHFRKRCSVDAKNVVKSEQHRHHSQKHDMMEKKCSECGKENLSAVTAAIHLKNEHGIKRCYVCKRCGKDFCTYSSLYVHFTKKCTGVNDRTALSSPYGQKHDMMEKSCKTCGICFDTVAATARHMKSEHAMKRCYICKKCGNTFLSQSSLHSHFLKKCQRLNDASALTSGDLSSPRSRSQKHDMMNKKCSLCSKDHETLTAAAQHLKIAHGMDKCYICKRCGKDFISHSSLHTHFLKRCTGVNDRNALIGRYNQKHDSMDKKCRKCGVSFESLTAIAKHMKNEHGMTRCYICRRCGKDFLGYAALHTHYLKKCTGFNDTGGRTTKYDDLMAKVCSYCNKESENVNAAAQHLKTEHGLQRCYVCKRCGKDFSLRTSLFVHCVKRCNGVRTNMHHGQKHDMMDKKCGECGKDSESLTAAAKHMKDEHGFERCYICKRCGKDFASHGSLLGHFLKRCTGVNDRSLNHGNQKHDLMEKVCKECGKESENINAAARHLKEEHGIKRCYVCKKCGRDFLRRTSLYLHFVKRCNGENSRKSRTYTQKYDMMDKKCPKCGEESCTIVAAARHLKNEHQMDRCYICKRCGRGFCSHGSLHMHFLKRCTGGADRNAVHHSQKHDLMDKVCGKCGKNSESITAAARHLKYEHGVKRCYICKRCKKDFTMRTTLYLHFMKRCSGLTSEGVTPRRHHQKYDMMDKKCVECDMDFDSIVATARHMKNEHGILKCFICKKCGKSFMRYGTLNSHFHDTCNDILVDIKKENAGSPRVNSKHHSQKYDLMDKDCSICGKTSYTLRGAASHMKIAHGISKCFICKKCGQGFMRYANLNAHHKRNCRGRTQTVKYDIMDTKCTVCGKENDSLKAAAMHLLNDHGLLKCFVCKWCGMGFERHSSMLTHFKLRCDKKGYDMEARSETSLSMQESSLNFDDTGFPALDRDETTRQSSNSDVSHQEQMYMPLSVQQFPPVIKSEPYEGASFGSEKVPLGPDEGMFHSSLSFNSLQVSQSQSTTRTQDQSKIKCETIVKERAENNHPSCVIVQTHGRLQGTPEVFEPQISDLSGNFYSHESVPEIVQNADAGTEAQQIPETQTSPSTSEKENCLSSVGAHQRQASIQEVMKCQKKSSSSIPEDGCMEESLHDTHDSRFGVDQACESSLNAEPVHLTVTVKQEARSDVEGTDCSSGLTNINETSLAGHTY